MSHNPTYHPEAVNKAIAASRQKIGKREAKMIHALLKGHDSEQS
jgi:hypothetical protein